MQARESDVWAGIGVVDGVHLAASHEGLAGVELPPEERVDEPSDGHDLGSRARRQEAVLDRIAQVHGLVRLKAHDHRLGADRQRAGEHVVVVDRLLQVHQHLAALVIRGMQFRGVPDPGYAAPGAAVVRLHIQRVTDPLRDGVQIEWPIDRVLERHEYGLRHLEPQPHHRAVSRVLFHRLKGERAVQQVHVVHQGDLLQPLPRVVVPVSEPVDDQAVAWVVAQAERLDGEPLAIEGMPGAAGAGHRAQPAQDLLESKGPVLLGSEQQADQVPGLGHWGLPSRIAACGELAGRARRASRAAHRGPTGQARA